MHQVVGVRFKKAGKIYYFSPGEFNINRDDYVIVETARGVEFGKVVIGVKEVDEKDVVLPLKNVLRLATEKDKLTVTENKQESQKAFNVCLEKIAEHDLEMKLVDVEYTFDRNKVLFYFTADGRIDFRELVKDLASVFRTRIELRQIGVRDEAKMLGGIGPCGRMLCCSTFLGDFEPVSIKMAKDQNLSLNPTKISGLCGRLMCCLKYENDMYESAKKELPDLNEKIETSMGRGKVAGLNMLERLVQVELFESGQVVEYTLDELLQEGAIATETTK
ncbi:stage 0 sporulation family protein [Salipaludibacillus agaradhaerens]|uniref:Stage 0 sporulation family protein n=1 Tax=Salipaludibacillus agaradhaerens TaxID=76935 RepID=A0A9Q4B4Z6_SALAG|nr:stage 0 sporulation family protein [Salipaludibacillus agaradhaerens]MCR6098429.1 stage 0 sporulation family protein [Salipaludibacillus agaradhaerens]MCR6115941.1 stage 0 sporulation family protein [Salipaludibacillus agaradhaerens]